MTRTTGVAVALATVATLMTGSTAGGAAPAVGAPAAELPREIPGGVELRLADGDRLRVWAADDHRTVWSRRRDAATGHWGGRLEVLRRPGLACGDVDARTANGAVAAVALCDRGSYYEDTAPVSSRALWSPDGVSWSSYGLEGEAYEEPGISPDGQNAVWPLTEAYAVRTAAGFSTHQLATPGQEYTATATITDAAEIAYLYGGTIEGECGLAVLTRTGDAPPVRQVLRLEDSCSDGELANADSHTVFVGGTPPFGRAVVSRPDDASPWAVTSIAPSSAPGLVTTEHGLYPDFFTAPGLPLLAVGGGPGGVVQAQRYDPVAQAWGSPSVVLDPPGRCSWGDNWAQPTSTVVAVRVRCSGRGLVLTTRDGLVWRVLRSGTHPVGGSPDGRYVVVPGRSSTHVISAELGVVRLPGGVRGRCDVVVPDGPDGAVLLSAPRRGSGWPSVLRHSSRTGWTRLSRAVLPTPTSPCDRAQAAFADQPDRFTLRGRRHDGMVVRIVQRDGRWTARGSSW